MNKDHCVTMQRYIEDCTLVEFGLCRRGKIWIPAAKFNEFCKRNSINVGYYFLLFLSAVYRLIILRSWMVTIIVNLFVIFQNLGF